MKCLVCASLINLIAFYLIAVFLVLKPLYKQALKTPSKKLALVQCAFSADITQKSVIIKTPLLFFFSFLALCRKERKGKKKSLLLPQTADILPCLGPLKFSSIVVTALSLIYMSSIQLQPVSCSVGIQRQFLTLHRNYFWSFKNTPSVTRCSYAGCLPREDDLGEESEATTSPAQLIQCCLCIWPLFMHDSGIKEQPQTSPTLGSGPRPAWRWEGGA